MTPRDLVCDRCWRDFFDTEVFEQCCTGSLQLNGGHFPFVESIAAVSEIRDADCNWCEYLRIFVRVEWPPEDRVTVHFSPSKIDACTPKGKNIFYLSISCHALDGKWTGGSALFVHAWTESENDASEYVTARPLQTDLSSDAMRMQLSTWLKECIEHERCRPSHQYSVLPTRVIEVSPSGQQHPRLLNSKDMTGIYATLSYCWGKDPFLILTRSNYNELIRDLDPLALPSTFADAISIARSMSIPYLWIDALCIVQDSEEDKSREIARMKDIYASSALTIVAASAESVFEGLFHPRHHTETSYRIPCRIRPGVFGSMFINELDAASYDERLEPIAKRAWTMQEQLLAQRTLTFTTRTMTWRCRVDTKNFGDSLYFPHDLDMGYNDNDDKYSLNLYSLLLNEEEARDQKDKTLSCWLRLVTAYSLRIASHEHDKLNAVAGIASHPSFSSSLGLGYFAGLWEYNLVRQLTWRTSHQHRTLPEDGSTIYRPLSYRAPSWSWASIEGGVVEFDFSFDDEEETAYQLLCDIIDCSTVLKPPQLNRFGEVSSGLLHIKAPARRAWLSPSTCNIFLLPGSVSTGSKRDLSYSEDVITVDEASARHVRDFTAKHPDIDLSEEPEATHGTDHRNMFGIHDETGPYDPVVVVCVATVANLDREDAVEGLLLVPSEVRGDNIVFKRIGVFERGKLEDFSKEAETEILIV